MKKICLDADGVLLNYNEAWRLCYNRVFQKNVQVINQHSYHAHEYCGLQPLNIEERQKIYAEFDKNDWKNLPAISGAIAATHYLKENDWKIYIVTSMNSKKLEDRIENFKKLGFPDFEDIIATGRFSKENPKKGPVEKIKPLYFVDDMKKNFEGLENITNCIYINKYNKEAKFLSYDNLTNFVTDKIIRNIRYKNN